MELKKGVQTVNYIAQLAGGTIGKLKILKIIWLADRLHLRKYGRPIVGDTYFAMKLGPVASGIKNICDQNEDYIDPVSMRYIKEYLTKQGHDIKTVKEPELSQFSTSDLEILRQVYDTFGSHTPRNLVEITHKYPEWKKFESRIVSGGTLQARMDYLDFFENTPSQDTIFDIAEEHLESSKAIFQEDAQLCRFFS